MVGPGKGNRPVRRAGAAFAVLLAGAIAVGGMSGGLANANDLTPTPAATTVPVATPTAPAPAADAATPSTTSATTSLGPTSSISPSAAASLAAAATAKATTTPTAAENAPTASPTTTPSGGAATATVQPRAVSDPVVTPQVVPPATGNNAVITVKVGSDRVGTTGVSNLAGVVLGFYDDANGTELFDQCTSDADGDCSITVPNTRGGGTNRDRRFFVKQISAPAGYYANLTLGVGSPVGVQNYVFETGNQLRAGQTYRSTAEFMFSNDNNNDVASGGIWQDSRINPVQPAKCGLTVAIVADLSNSVGGDLGNLKDAATTFVNSLVGTPSSVALFTFATDSPATGGNNINRPAPVPVSTQDAADTVNASINAWTLPGGNNGGTNWDRGFAAVAAAAQHYDVVAVITDGNPTFFSTNPVEGPGNRTRFREVENGIFSANAVKAKNTRMIAVGVGSGVSSAAAGLNLKSISGPTLNSDYYQTSDYTAAGEALRALALGNCQGTLTVVKQVLPAGTPADSLEGAVPTGGWTFGATTGASGVTINPASGVTAAGTGALNFDLTFPGGTTTAATTVTETQQAGFTLHPVDGLNAVCTRLDTSETLPVTNVDPLGFTLPAASNYPASCTVYNVPVPQAHLTLVKTVTKDNGGTAVPTDWTLTATGPTPISGVVGDATVTDAPVDAGSYVLSEAGPAGYTASVWTCEGGTVTGATVVVPTGGDVTCTINNDDQAAQLTLVKTVTNNNGGTAVPTEWTLTATGPTPISGVVGDATVTDAPVDAGSYVLSEAGPVGYTASVWTCEGGTVTGATVVVPTGGDVTCTINNDDQAAQLTLIKVVDNGDTGATAVATDWTLTATGPTPISGVVGDATVTDAPVDAGSYVLSEAGPDGYTASAWTCDSPGPTAGQVVVPPGGNVTCTITNTAVPGTWTVTKSSDPASGSTVLPGTVITYTVTATHLDGVDPLNVVVTDNLSDVLNHATLVEGSVDPSLGDAAVTGTTLTWNIPVLSAQETVTYKVRINDDAFGVAISNVVTGDGDGFEPCVPQTNLKGAAASASAVPLLAPVPPTTPDTSCDSTTHETPAWSLSKSSDPASGSTVEPGGTITYTLTAVNTFTAPVVGAIATDDLSDVLAHGTLVAVPDGATLEGTTLTWAVPTLAAQGDSAQLTYQVKVNDDAFNVTIGNVVTAGPGGTCTTCTTSHTTPPQPVTPAVPENPATPVTPTLPDTGSDVAPYLGAAGALLLLGGGAVLWARRRNNVLKG